MDKAKIGGYSFILGLVLALVLGVVAQLITLSEQIVTGLIVLLVLLGLVVGLLNISKKNVKDFLIAVIAIGVIGSANLSVIPFIGEYMALLVAYLAVFVMPAALVVAVKEVLNIGKM